mgnify:CR=1 FL=1
MGKKKAITIDIHNTLQMFVNNAISGGMIRHIKLLFSILFSIAVRKMSAALIK